MDEEDKVDLLKNKHASQNIERTMLESVSVNDVSNPMDDDSVEN